MESISQLRTHGICHAPAFVFTQQTVIHKKRAELTADRAVHQCSRHAGIHPAAHRSQHMPLSNLSLDAGNAFADNVFRCPVSRRPADLCGKRLQHGCADGCVLHFRMKLDAVDAALGVTDGGDGAAGAGCQHAETHWKRLQPIAVRHPDLV